MKEDFLTKYRPPVRKAFADSLYQRLSQIELDNRLQQKGVYEMVRSVMSRSMWKFAVPVLMSAAILVLAISEPVRAKTMELIQIVAGFTVEERDESPIKAIAPNEDEPALAAENIAISATMPAPVVEPTVFTIPVLAISELLANPPFEFALPAWIPEGYELEKSVGISTSQYWVSLLWNHTNLSEIEMLVEREYNGYAIPAGENSSEEITINGQPALLVRGFWDGQHQWDLRRGITLDWEKDGHHYRLNYTQRDDIHHEIVPIEGDVEAILQELVKMAESIP